MGTGNLVNSIKADIIMKEGFKTINFYNDAKNERGQFYAGHMEYGFHDRGGNFIPARPFMRPALYAVSEGSKSNFRQIMAGLLQNLWTGKGFQGVSNLTFGTKAMHPTNTFWGNKNFAKHIERQSQIKNLKGSAHRKQMSTMRTLNKNAVKKRTGFKLANNRRDYLRLRSQSPRQKTSSKKSSSKNTTKTSASHKNKEKGSSHKPNYSSSIVNNQYTGVGYINPFARR